MVKRMAKATKPTRDAIKDAESARGNRPPLRGNAYMLREDVGMLTAELKRKNPSRAAEIERKTEYMTDWALSALSARGRYSYSQIIEIVRASIKEAARDPGVMRKKMAERRRAVLEEAMKKGGKRFAGYNGKLTAAAEKLRRRHAYNPEDVDKALELAREWLIGATTEWDSKDETITELIDKFERVVEQIKKQREKSGR